MQPSNGVYGTRALRLLSSGDGNKASRGIGRLSDYRNGEHNVSFVWSCPGGALVLAQTPPRIIKTTAERTLKVTLCERAPSPGAHFKQLGCFSFPGHALG